MKAPRLQVGQGTLGRFKRSRPLVLMTLRHDGHADNSEPKVGNWYDMSVREARALAARLLKAAARAEGRCAR